MLSTIEAQVVSLIMAVFAGLMVGMLFDLYRTINYYARPSKAFLYFMDLLFWITTGAVVFVILLNADFAELRVYTFGGIGIGIFMYFKLFSEYILKFYRLLFYIIAKTLRMVLIVLSLPFKLLYNLAWTPLDFLRRKTKAFLRFIKRKIKRVLKWKK